MKEFAFPKAVLDQHIAILGKTGSGKTFCAKGLVEHLLNQKRQVCVLDPTSAWWGLRLAADGKGSGFDVVLLGGEHGDIPLSERSGAAVARLVTEQRANVVIDTGGMTVGEYTRWFIDFAGTLYTTIKNPLHLVIDEAHYFMPQSRTLSVDGGKMLHNGNRLMSGGRSRGVRGMMITQRPAKLHKDSLTCADTLIAMRMIAPQDRAAVGDWIDGAGDPAKGKSVLDSLAGLARGEGWVWYPEGGYMERLKFPPIRTFDSSAAPKHGQKAGPTVTAIDLDEVKAAMAEAVREAEANDPKLLKAEVAKLKRELAAKPTTATDPAKLEAEYSRGVADEQRRWMKGLNGYGADLQRHGSATIKVGEALVGLAGAKTDVPKNWHMMEMKPVKASAAISPRPERPPPADGEQSLGRGGLRRMLIALAQRPGLTNSQLGVRAGLSSKSGTFSTYLGRGRANGWIRDEGERRFATEDGLAALGEYEALPEGSALLDYWLAELGNGGASRMLRAYADIYPTGLSNEACGEAAGISPASGTFSTYLGRLRKLELVEGRGEVRASAELFD